MFVVGLWRVTSLVQAVEGSGLHLNQRTELMMTVPATAACSALSSSFAGFWIAQPVLPGVYYSQTCPAEM